MRGALGLLGTVWLALWAALAGCVQTGPIEPGMAAPDSNQATPAATVPLSAAQANSHGNGTASPDSSPEQSQDPNPDPNADPNADHHAPTYWVIRASGTLNETGPAYELRSACGIGLQVGWLDAPTRQLWATRDTFRADAAEATLAAYSSVRIQKVRNDGCTVSDWAIGSVNGSMDWTYAWHAQPLRLEARGNVTVDGVPLPPGASHSYDVSWTRSVDHGDGPANYTYAGTIRVENLGQWPRDGLHVLQHGWQYGCPPQGC